MVAGKTFKLSYLREVVAADTNFAPLMLGCSLAIVNSVEIAIKEVSRDNELHIMNENRI
jgi:hypothetical protein